MYKAEHAENWEQWSTDGDTPAKAHSVDPIPRQRPVVEMHKSVH